MTKHCRQCGLDFPEEEFFRRTSTRMHLRRMAVCIGCETTRRTEEKERDRTMVKARDTIRRHAARLRVSVETLSERFGWMPAQIKHDIEHAAKNGCPYCHRSFASMGHGLADITIDIIDPAKPPFYTTNTKIACQTCNREKAKTAPETWAGKLICWARWENHQRRISLKPTTGLALWDWLDKAS